jgi:hypothetical protein
VIDLPALRSARSRLGMSNFLSRQPYAAYTQGYAAASGAEVNTAAKGPLDRDGLGARQRRAIEKMREKGVLR